MSGRRLRVPAEAIPVEAFLEDYPPAMREIADRLRSIVRDAVPEATERVRLGWRLVAYDLTLGRRTAFFAWVGPEMRHVHLGFPRGVQMAVPTGTLQGVGVTKLARWLTFVPGDPIDEDALHELVLEAARIAWLPRFVPWTIEAALPG